MRKIPSEVFGEPSQRVFLIVKGLTADDVRLLASLRVRDLSGAWYPTQRSIEHFIEEELIVWLW